MVEFLDFAYISILLTLAAAFGIIANKLKQPPLLGYILAGVFVNAINIFPESEINQIELFSKIGIAFLLFILGMELDLRELKRLGKVVLITGVGQIIFTTFFGFLISRIQGFEIISSIFIAIALTFSSTIVIVKLLTSQKELTTLHGKIAVGFLLVQDFAAILMLIGLSAVGAGGADGGVILNILSVFLKISILVGILYVVSKFIIPWIIKQTGHDREVLFLTMSAWALFFATLVSIPIFGFSIEIGALCAGIALSSQKENLQIESWMRPLRDFFLSLFFVMLGLHIHIDNIQTVLLPSLIFSTFVLIGNPLIVMILMGILGYKKRIGFYISLTVAQISEFSLLVASMGVSMQFLDNNALTIITLVGGITMTVSTYMIYHKDTLYKALQGYLSIFEKKHPDKKISYAKNMKNHIVVFGLHRLGGDLGMLITENKKKFLIVDHDPVQVNKLNKKKYNVIFGDMHDIDLYDKVKLEDSVMVISTVPDYHANLTLLNFLDQIEYEGIVVVTAQNDYNALQYYENGATYVVYPHLIAGQRLSKIVDTQLNQLNGEEVDSNAYLQRLMKRQLSHLNKRIDNLKK